MSRPLLLVAAAALVDEAGAVMITQRPDGKAMAGLWEFPGGKLEPGETPEEALVRELREEVGLTVDAADLTAFTFASFTYEAFHLLMPLYICRRWVGEPQPIDVAAVRFVQPRAMGAFAMPPADAPLVAALQRGLNLTSTGA